MGAALEGGKTLPALFKSAAWKYTDRHLSPKKAKVDCLGSGGYLTMQEGGFLTSNPESVFVHYEVHHSDPLVLVQGQEGDVVRFELCLNDAVALVREVIEKGITRG